MAQNEIYQAAMNDGANAAWDKDWGRAVQAYQQALEIAPGDPQALAGLALGLMESGKDEQALAAYTEINKLMPSDPLPLEKMAEIYDRAGQRKQASQQYLAAAEVYFARKDIQRAIPNWESAVQMNPDQPQAHMRLALIYERNEQTRQQAVYSYLHVARLVQQLGNNQRAEQALQRAMSIDPLNNDVREAQTQLRQGYGIQVPDAPAVTTKTTQVTSKNQPQLIEALSQEDELLQAIEEAEASGHTPIEVAARDAMGILADIIWTGEVPPNAQAPLLQGIDAHQIGDVDAAIDLYNKALNAGLDHPALHFSLGVLLQYTRQFEAAVKQLKDTLNFADFAFAGHLMLGQSLYALGNMKEAAFHSLNALLSADQLLNTASVDDSGYERIIDSLPEQPAEYLTEVTKALSFYLEDDKWDRKLRTVLDGYAAKNKVSYVRDLIEMIIEGGKPEIATVMQRIDEYLERDLLDMASEEAHFAIERSPDYLPAHRRLADILIREARTQEAAEKLNLIANTYLVRGNEEKAADLFTMVINLWPADIGARRKAIDMLRSQNRFDEALTQYADLANVYYQLMADPDKALQVYNEAMEYARQFRAEPQKITPVLRAMAEIESQRLNWQKALAYFERANDLAPGDPVTVSSIIDLYFQTGDEGKAITALDDLLRGLFTSNQVGVGLKILEDQARRRPNNIAIRQRLAEVYRQRGKPEEAITQLDALAELQMDSQRTQDAIQTIKKIIALNPPDIAGYKKLLAQLESGSQ